MNTQKPPVLYEWQGTPAIEFTDLSFGDPIQMTFGLLDGEHCIAIFLEDNPKATMENGTRVAFISKKVLELALEQLNGGIKDES
tara:strand:- start:7558 stop:7809 length:252 start_codon:yes stop_codon:yes gene_type:complete